ncbi:hypothetical protein GO986_13050 [Deinococcus sp. HMF7620]|uniref:DUF4440 domain-containing protein n=1 Tax=Deinococcus arboris TaxID=2682977 RepID=A0A7C9HZE8_9DEIO|nr:hypothetical protein [Deinococcus arboris]MVN87688.1 hypothetical protein [Deinococcus arboris]
MKRLLLLSLLTALTGASAQTNKPSDAQLLAGAKTFFAEYLAAHAANDGKRVASLYHDSARIIVTRQSATTGNRTLELTGAQYKKLAVSVPLTETPDRYFNVSYQVKGAFVQISAQRQSLSRGYTAPNILFVQPDAAGRFWIMAEQGVQVVK